MEFKFREVDDRPPPYSSSASSSNFAFFTQRPFQAGSQGMDPGQNPEIILRNEMVQHEIEKERVREEIIVAEIARRRMLEAEVRRELMMEQEMAMRVGGGQSFEERLTMQLDSRLSFPFINQFDSFYLLEDRLAFSRRGLFDSWRQASLAPEVIKPVLEDNKDKLIMLAKPDPNLCGAKRKAATPPTVSDSEFPFAGLKKKPKEEWSCALCQVSATSERGLNEHIQGRKHKAKEAGLRAQNLAKNSRTPPPSKKSANRSKPAASAVGLELEEKVGKQSILQVNERDAIIDIKEDREVMENKSDGMPALTTRDGINLINKNRKAEVRREGMTMKFKKKKLKKFKFWCEMCQIGAYSEVVMEAHKRGRKHIAQLREVVQNTTNKASPKDGDKDNVSDEIAEAAIKNETEIVDADEITMGSFVDKEKTTENVVANALDELAEAPMKKETEIVAADEIIMGSLEKTIENVVANAIEAGPPPEIN